MANTNNPFGFRQFGQREGTSPTAGFERFTIASSDTNLYFTGDVVGLSSGGGAGVGTITVISSISGVAALANSVLGVFLGCKFFNPATGRVTPSSFFPGNVGSSSPCDAYVCTNMEQLYIAQGTSGAVLGTSNIGYGVFPSLTGSSLGNQATGISAQTIVSSQVTGLSSNGVFKIVDVYSNTAPPGVNGTSTGAEGFQIMILQPNSFSRRSAALLSS